MKKMGKRLLSAGLCLCMLFLAACSSGDDNLQDKSARAMGRYVESHVTLPEDFMPVKLLKRSDETLVLFGYNADEKYVMHSSADGETWSPASLLELPDSDSRIHFNSAAYDKDDRLHLLMSGYMPSGDQYRFFAELYRENAEGLPEKVDIQWVEDTGELDRGVDASGIRISDDDDFVISQQDVGYVQYAKDGSLKHVYRENTLEDYTAIYSSSQENNFYALSGSRLYIKDDPSSSILSFDMDTGELLQELPLDSYTPDTVLASGTEGGIYAINSSGIFRLLAGGNMWEKIVDGNLSSLSLPTAYYKDFAAMADGTLYMLVYSSDAPDLLKYTYDETIASVPEKEIIVYTLQENAIVRQAAGEYQRLHPDTMINIQVADGSGSTVTSDLIRALNTELLAGKGPDVIILDGMNVESYIDKDVLADISDVILEVDTQGGGLLSGIKKAYERDGTIYAIPARFTLPVMIADQETSDQLKTLEDAAAFASANQNKGLLGNRSPEVLLNQFLPVCAGAWISDGKINEEELESFLVSLRTIYDVSAENYPLSGLEFYSEEDENLFHWVYGRAHTQMISITSGYSDLMLLSAVKESKPDTILSYMPGQVERAYVPGSIAGINANSAQIDEAKSFIALVLSEELQMRQLFDGIPVNEGALEKLIAEEEGVFVSIMSPIEGEMLLGGWPTIEEQRELKELCMNIKTPFLVDNTMLQMIIDGASGYIRGEKGLVQTINDIDEATKLYLSE